MTDPDDVDSDNDGWEDGVELLLGYDPLDPGDPPPGTPDSDQDGVPDAFDPDPTKKDADGDRYFDFYELVQGSDPLDALSIPLLGNNIAPETSVITLADVVWLYGVFLGEIDPGNTPLWRMDLNRDGSLTIADMAILRAYYLGEAILEGLPQQ